MEYYKIRVYPLIFKVQHLKYSVTINGSSNHCFGVGADIAPVPLHQHQCLGAPVHGFTAAPVRGALTAAPAVQVSVHLHLNDWLL